MPKRKSEIIQTPLFSNVEIENENDIEVGEETEDDLTVDYLDKISEAVTWSTDWTVESLINQLDREVIDLNPKFQRRDAWNESKKSRFIESLVYGLPIPQIVLAESPHVKGKYIVVDGKQRLITLKQFCSPSEKNPSKFTKLVKLKNPKLNDLTFKQLEEGHKSFFNNFINQSIRSVIIKNWPSETFLYTIFYRLNTGSLSLSPQELRRALKPGDFMDFVDEFSGSSKEIQKLFNLKGPDYRMRDMDLVIRYFSFAERIKEYKGDYKSFLDSTCDFFNKTWGKNKVKIQNNAERLEILIDTVNKVFKADHAFKRWRNSKYESRLNKAIFDIMIYYIQSEPIRLEFISKGMAIVESFKKLCTSNAAFLKSISSNTNNLIETSNRFVIWGKELKKVLKEQVEIPSNLSKIANDTKK
jgi:hypothetical protein